jgi:hypothetical protein
MDALNIVNIQKLMKNELNFRGAFAINNLPKKANGSGIIK